MGPSENLGLVTSRAIESHGQQPRTRPSCVARSLSQEFVDNKPDHSPDYVRMRRIVTA